MFIPRVQDWGHWVSSSINVLVILYVACEMPCYRFGSFYSWLSSKRYLLLCKSIPQHDILPQIQGYYSTYSSFIIHFCTNIAFIHWLKKHHENLEDCSRQRWWHIQCKEMLTTKSRKRLIARLLGCFRWAISPVSLKWKSLQSYFCHLEIWLHDQHTSDSFLEIIHTLTLTFWS